MMAGAGMATRREALSMIRGRQAVGAPPHKGVPTADIRASRVFCAERATIRPRIPPHPPLQAGPGRAGRPVARRWLRGTAAPRRRRRRGALGDADARCLAGRHRRPATWRLLDKAGAGRHDKRPGLGGRSACGSPEVARSSSRWQPWAMQDGPLRAAGGAGRQGTEVAPAGRCRWAQPSTAPRRLPPLSFNLRPQAQPKQTNPSPDGEGFVYVVAMGDRRLSIFR